MAQYQYQSPDLPNAREFIQSWLAQHKLSAAQLSRITGLKQYTISRFLNGKVDEVDLVTATRLYSALANSLSAEERVKILHWLGLGTLMNALRQSGEAFYFFLSAEREATGAESKNADRDTARAMIEAWMREHKVSQAELARRAEIDASRIGRFLRGNIEAKTAARIYHAVHESFNAEERSTLLRTLGLREIAMAIMASREEDADEAVAGE